MIRIDPERRMMTEFRSLALDLRSRMASIDVARIAKPGYFSRALVEAVRNLGKVALQERGGTMADSPSAGNAQIVADEMAASCSRVVTLSGKLARGRRRADALVMAGVAVREAMTE